MRGGLLFKSTRLMKYRDKPEIYMKFQTFLLTQQNVKFKMKVNILLRTGEKVYVSLIIHVQKRYIARSHERIKKLYNYNYLHILNKTIL